METLRQKRLFLLDMDGTIYLDNNLFDRTLDFLDYVKQIGGRYMFLTNNSSKSVDKYIEKLKSLGISSTAEDFLTSTDATIVELKKVDFTKFMPLVQTLLKSSLPLPVFPSPTNWRMISIVSAWGMIPA